MARDRFDDGHDLDDRYDRAEKPHRGTLILVFGILAFVICGLFGVAALIMGNNDLREMREGTMDREGESLTNTGRILGLVATILMVVGLVLGVAIIALGGMR